MKIKYYLFIVSVTMYLQTYCQTIFINSITESREPSGDNGYTLDGSRMTAGSRWKLLNSGNFSSSGIYPKNISIFDGFGTTGSLTGVSAIPINHIFFFGSFNKLDASTQQFTNAEIDSLYNWSLRGGKLIIASGGSYSNFYDANILDSKWGYSYQSQNPGNFVPNANGNNTSIFNGTFGNVIAANQGAGAQGYFSSLTSNSKVLATDSNGNPTLFMDCNTLDLIIADVDGYTDLGGITSGAMISNAQDKFWANTIVFMDKLQDIPTINQNGMILSTPDIYCAYQWYENDSPMLGLDSNHIAINQLGQYYVEVTLNGGCKVKSNTINIRGLMSIEENIVISILPNPAANRVKITYPDFKNQKAIVEIYDVLSRETKITELFPNSNETEISVMGYKPGIYFYRVIVENAVFGKGKLVIE